MGDEGWKNMPPLISPETTESLASAISNLTTSQKEPFATVLHGGEPLMLGEHRLRDFLLTLRSNIPLNYPISMQTNGMLITEKIADICSENRVSISISLDGPKSTNDRFRLDKQGKSTYSRVINGINILRRHSDSEFLYAGLLAVVDPKSNPKEIYEHLKSLGAPSIDFLYRDGNHDKIPYCKESFETTEYGDWLSAIFSIYIQDKNPPRVRFLDDLVKLTLGGKGTKEGLGDTDYGILIIDTNGSINKNDTLKSNFEGADRFNESWSIQKDSLELIKKSAEIHSYHELQRPTSEVCLSCQFLHICGGGMPLHRWSKSKKYDNPSIYCSDQKALISKVIESLKNEGIEIDINP